MVMLAVWLAYGGIMAVPLMVFCFIGYSIIFLFRPLASGLLPFLFQALPVIVFGFTGVVYIWFVVKVSWSLVVLATTLCLLGGAGSVAEECEHANLGKPKDSEVLRRFKDSIPKTVTLFIWSVCVFVAMIPIGDVLAKALLADAAKSSVLLPPDAESFLKFLYSSLAVSIFWVAWLYVKTGNREFPAPGGASILNVADEFAVSVNKGRSFVRGVFWLIVAGVTWRVGSWWWSSGISFGSIDEVGGYVIYGCAVLAAGKGVLELLTALRSPAPMQSSGNLGRAKVADPASAKMAVSGDGSRPPWADHGHRD